MGAKRWSGKFDEGPKVSVFVFLLVILSIFYFIEILVLLLHFNSRHFVTMS